MSGDAPLVSIIIPARNEEQDVGACLGAIADLDYPGDRLEVLVVDGCSTDRTAELAAKALATLDVERGEVIENAAMTTPSSLNRGLVEARGELFCRVDARSLVPRHYVRGCVDLLTRRPEVAVVGGSQSAEARPGSGIVPRGIARALQNPYATGFARYRRGTRPGPTDTVYLGAFRTADLRAVGGWDERFLTNQDYELNRRMARLGLVWFDPSLEVKYRPRESLRDLARQYRRFGRWKAAAWSSGVEIAPRQVALVVLPPVAVGATVWTALRHPRLTGLGLLVTVVALDRSVSDAATPRERVAALVAMGVLGVGWWGGVAEGVVHACRSRLSASDPS